MTEVNDWCKPKATEWEELGFRSSPHSFFKRVIDGQISKG